MRLNRGTVGEKPDKPGRTLRISALLPLLLSAVTFGLTIPILIAGAKKGQLNDVFLMSLNASNVGHDVIRFEPTTSSGSSGDLGGLTSIFGGLIDNITSTIDGSLQDFTNTAITNLAKEFGIKDFYDFYLLNICEGSLEDASNGKENEIQSSCSSYLNKLKSFNSLGSSVPSSLTIGTTKVSAPILNKLATSLKTLGGTLSTVIEAITAFYIISLVGSGITLIGSFLGMLFARSSAIAHVTLGFSALAVTFHLIASATITITMSVVNDTLGSIGATVSLLTERGKRVLIFTWIGFACILVAEVYWFSVWYVEFKTFVIQIRKRDPASIGNWRGARRELKSNLFPKSTV